MIFHWFFSGFGVPEGKGAGERVGLVVEAWREGRSGGKVRRGGVRGGGRGEEGMMLFFLSRGLQLPTAGKPASL